MLLISLALVRFRAWATCFGTGEGDQIEDFGQRRLDDDDDNDGGGRCAGVATLAGPKKRRGDIESQLSVAECASCWRGSESTCLNHDSRALKNFESFSKRFSNGERDERAKQTTFFFFKHASSFFFLSKPTA